jgi:peptidoglycan L-alanyl-D-glutamate endopeptidase CwlK
MRKFGKASKAQLDTLDIRLQSILTIVLREVADISILQGHRGQKEQNEAFYGDPQTSKLPWPRGKHNKLPSLAVDIQPYPRPKTNYKLAISLAYIAGRAVQLAADEGITLRWGGDWDRDGDMTDNDFDDLFHLEIVEQD